jgi:hypothetical protein
MSRRRTLLRSLAAFCARIRPRNTAELASLVLYLGEEIDRRERMLDVALRDMATVPGKRIPGSPAASRLPARAAQPEQIGKPAPYDALAQGERSRHGRVAGSRTEPGDVADASGDPDGHGRELILDQGVLAWSGHRGAATH